MSAMTAMSAFLFHIRVQPGKELKPFLGFFDGGFVNDRVACTLIHGNVRVGVG
jgi:hypothetical protein